MNNLQQEIDFLRARVQELERMNRENVAAYFTTLETLNETVIQLQTRLFQVDPVFRANWTQQHPEWKLLPESL